ncbi:uncharacterized protein LOC143668785 [Tamandua tetradactyla]|uniref:uncharacterized protein LOC143668785 n=1 Tax=Tamandua tetradactyla TaxID=48850 RepID=UPI004053E70D
MSAAWPGCFLGTGTATGKKGGQVSSAPMHSLQNLKVEDMSASKTEMALTDGHLVSTEQKHRLHVQRSPTCASEGPVLMVGRQPQRPLDYGMAMGFSKEKSSNSRPAFWNHSLVPGVCGRAWGLICGALPKAWRLV